MNLLRNLGLAGWISLATATAHAQTATATDTISASDARPRATPAARDTGAKRPPFPVINIRMEGETTIGELVQHVRTEVAKDKTSSQTVNILMGPGVAELKAPADLNLINVTPLGLFGAISAVEPRLTFTPVSNSENEMTITLQLRPNSRSQGTAKDVKLRVFKLPVPRTVVTASPEERERAHRDQAEAIDILDRNLNELLTIASRLRESSGGESLSKGFQFRLHPGTRTVLVSGTAEDLDLAEEVLKGVGATASGSANPSPDANIARPARPF